MAPERRAPTSAQAEVAAVNETSSSDMPADIIRWNRLRATVGLLLRTQAVIMAVQVVEFFSGISSNSLCASPRCPVRE